MIRSLHRLAGLAVPLQLFACQAILPSPDRHLSVDASGSDARVDGGLDADSTIDAMVDAASDAMMDAASDAMMDAASDAMMDAASDAMMDAASDAMTDAGTDAGTNSDLTCPFGLVCSDYEAGSSFGTISCPNGMTRVAPENAAFGSAGISLNFTNGDFRNCGLSRTFAATTDLWVRTWIRRTGTTNFANAIRLGRATDPDTAEIVASVGLVSSAIFIRNVDPAFASGDLYPQNTWVCVEVHASISGSTLRAELFSNGVSRATTMQTDSPISSLSFVQLGWYAEATNGFSLAYDNTVVSTTRVPCGVRQ